MTRAIATKFGKSAVRAVCVAPGGIYAGQHRDFIARYNRRTPLGRMGLVDDIAVVVTFLASDKARYITGTCITVDGGRTAW